MIRSNLIFHNNTYQLHINEAGTKFVSGVYDYWLAKYKREPTIKEQAFINSIIQSKDNFTAIYFISPFYENGIKFAEKECNLHKYVQQKRFEALLIAKIKL